MQTLLASGEHRSEAAEQDLLPWLLLEMRRVCLPRSPLSRWCVGT